MKKSVTIANGASLSGAADFGPIGRLRAIKMSAAWTAASITFAVSDDGTTFQPLYDSGAELAFAAAAADRYISLNDAQVKLFSCWQYVKVRSGTAGVPVNQGADRTLELLGDEPN